MKKFFGKLMMSLLCVLITACFSGCAGFSANQAVSTASNIGLALVLKNNPQYKAPTLLALNGIKVFLGGDVTYDQLLAEIEKYKDPEYAYIVTMLKSELSTDTPVSTTYLTLFDDYKADLIKRIDAYIAIASI